MRYMRPDFQEEQALAAVTVPAWLFYFATLLCIPIWHWIYVQALHTGYELFMPWTILSVLVVESLLTMYLFTFAPRQLNNLFHLRFISSVAHIVVATWIAYVAITGIGIWHYWTGPLLLIAFLATEVFVLFVFRPTSPRPVTQTDHRHTYFVWFSRTVYIALYVLASVYYLDAVLRISTVAAARHALLNGQSLGITGVFALFVLLLLYAIFVLALRAPEYALKKSTLRDRVVRGQFFREEILATVLAFLTLLFG